MQKAWRVLVYGLARATQIGKRNKNLNKEAIKLAKEIRNINNKASKWNANNAITELTSEPVQNRLKIK